MISKFLINFSLIIIIIVVGSCNPDQPDESAAESPILGNYFQFSLSSKNLNQSLDFYRKLQFQIISVKDKASPPWALISDGSNMIMLSQNSFPSPTLTFYGKNLENRLNLLKNKGISYESITDDNQKIKSAIINSKERVEVSLINFKTEKLPRPRLNPNFLLGKFDGIILPSAAVQLSTDFWKKMGFTGSPFDGSSSPIHLIHPLLNLTLYPEENQAQPVLSYIVADMASLTDFFKQAGIEFTESNISQGHSRIGFYSPDRQLFFVGTVQ
jgi:hypothetical protein